MDNGVTIPTPIIVVLITLLGGAIIAPLLAWWLNRNKDGAALAHSALGVANDTMTQLVEAKKEIAELRAKIESFESRPAVYVGLSVHPERMEARVMEIRPLMEE